MIRKRACGDENSRLANEKKLPHLSQRRHCNSLLKYSAHEAGASIYADQIPSVPAWNFKSNSTVLTFSTLSLQSFQSVDFRVSRVAEKITLIPAQRGLTSTPVHIVDAPRIRSLRG